VDAIAASFGRPDRVSFYPHVLYISTKSEGVSHGACIKAVQSTFYRTRKEAVDSKRNEPAYLVQVPISERKIEEGIWICASGGLARTWLLRLALRVLTEQKDQCVARCVLFLHMPAGGGLVRSGRSTSYTGELFWRNAIDLLNRYSSRAESGELMTIVDESESDPANIHLELTVESKNSMSESHEPVRTALTFPANNPATIRRYTRTVPGKARKGSIPMDLGILTVTGDEIVAIREFLGARQGYQERQGHIHNRAFYEGTLSSATSSLKRVVVTRTLSQGNRSISAAYRALIDEYSPRIVVLLGIAGGIHKDLKLCDVVIADSVHYYDRRAETADGSCRRIESFTPRSSIRALANRVFDELGDLPRLAASNNSFEDEFSVFFGPIGCGEAVIKYREAEERIWLQRVNDKMLALETEAAGASQQFEEDELRSDVKTQGLLIIRGISDHADHAKDDRWRKPAVHNAMKCLELIASLCSPVRND